MYVATLEGDEAVVGYYALAAAQVAADDATARALKGQPASEAGAGDPARAARRRSGSPTRGTGPKSLLQDGLLRCVEAAEAIGARVLLVHAKHDAAKAWYIQFGFEESPTDAAPPADAAEGRSRVPQAAWNRVVETVSPRRRGGLGAARSDGRAVRCGRGAS